jgi:hypothetical protein
MAGVTEPTPHGTLSIIRNNPEALADIRSETDIETLNIFFGNFSINGVIYSART